jgi:ribosome-binding protein aMBF1 (putative translation factor)
VIFAYKGHQPQYEHVDENPIYSERYKKIVRRLINARIVAGLTQADLGLKIGLGQPEISRIETFQRQITVTELLDWIEASSCKALLPIIDLLAATHDEG